MKFNKRVKNFGLKHYDIILGLIFFLSYRLFFTWLLWHGRNVPPEPDDSYFYLAAARHFPRPENFEEFRLLLFSFWLNLVGFITGGTLETAYKINFYIGPVVMFSAIVLFLKKFELNKNSRLLIFIFLSLFTGNGQYHGFYWVVPSFYQLLLFFILAALFFDNRRIDLKILIPAIFAFIFVHPSSPLVLVIFVLVLPFLIIADRKNFKSYLKKSLTIFVVGLVATGIYVVISSKFPQTQSPESPFSILMLLGEILHGRAQFVSWNVVWSQYFVFFFLNPLTVFASVSALYFCWVAGAKKLLAIFFSSIAIVLISIVIPYGYRTLEFTWALTFIVLAYALIGLKKWIIQHYNFLIFVPAVAFVMFFLVVTNLNLVWINSVNINKNYSWNRSCVKNTSTTTFFNSNDALYAFQLYGMKSKDTILLTNLTQNDSLYPNVYFVTVSSIPVKSENLSLLQKFLTGNVTRKSQVKKATVATGNYWNQTPISTQDFKQLLAEKNLRPEPIYNCGYFVIYKINNV